MASDAAAAASSAAACAAPAPPPAPSVVAARPPAPRRVRVHFQAVGSAKRMRKMKFKLDSGKRFAMIHEFVRAQLGLTSGQQLFLYVRSAFAPALDTTVAELFQCFSVGGEQDPSKGELIVNYSMTEAWG